MQSNNVQYHSSEDNMTMSKDSDLTCTAVSDVTGTVCGEKSGLNILDEFRKMYQDRIHSVDPADKNGTEVKMKIMKEWIDDLDAQNTMLVRTVEELEEAACCRVKMLEEKLKHTSCILSQNMSRRTKSDGESLNELSQRINELGREEHSLKQKIHYLENDINSLLQLIRRAQTENCWRLDGIKFFQLRPSEIPMPEDNINGQAMGDNKNIESYMQQLQMLHDNEKKLRTHQQDLERTIQRLENKLVIKDKTIENLFTQFEAVKNTFKHRSEATAEFQDEIFRVLDSVESEFTVRKNKETQQDKEVAVQVDDQRVEIEELRNLVEESKREIARLIHQLNELEKESTETRDALTLEVAEKHDLAMAQKEQIMNLKEQCRQFNTQIHFKDDIIKEMRREIKRLLAKGSPTKSPTKDRINFHEISQNVSSSDDGSDDNLLSYITNAKLDSRCEYDKLLKIKQEIEEMLERTNVIETEAHEQSLEEARATVNHMRVMLADDDDQVLKPVDHENTRRIGVTTNAETLKKIIAVLSGICMEKNKGMLQLELARQNVHEKNERIRDLEAEDKLISSTPIPSREQFNAMEEYRICTVEAQAATEDLREEMETVINNLQCRHELYSELSSPIEKLHEVVRITKENLLTVIKYIKVQVDEKNLAKTTIISGQAKLKDLKNEINETLSKLTANEGKFGDQHENIGSKLLDKAVEEVDYLVFNLGVFISKEDNGVELLMKLHDQVAKIQLNLEDMQTLLDRVLRENVVAQEVFEKSAKKLDRSERELDDAHTKMQDTLEHIVLVSRQNDSSTSNDDENYSQHIAVEIEQLQKALCSKDKLLENKDEIIRIQKNSIDMTQEELKDLHLRLQSKIDAQLALIDRYQSEIKNLLEQSSLQGQTIRHLQDAIVEAKKNINRHSSHKSVGFSPITPTVFNNEDIHDQRPSVDEEVKQRMEHLVRENNDMKRQLLAYSTDIDMLNEKMKRSIEENSTDDTQYQREMSQKYQIQGLKNKLIEYSKKMMKLYDKLQVFRDTIKQQRSQLSAYVKKFEDIQFFEADYERIKKTMLIVMSENQSLQLLKKEDTLAQCAIRELKDKLSIVQDNYQRVCLDLEKSQKRLNEATKREVDLQHSLTVANPERNEAINKLQELFDIVHLELKNTQDELLAKESALNQYENMSKCQMEQIKFLQRQIQLYETQYTELTRTKGCADRQFKQQKEIQYCRTATKSLKRKGIKHLKSSKDYRSSIRLKRISSFSIKRTEHSCSRLVNCRPYSSSSQLPTEKVSTNIICQWCPKLERMSEELQQQNYQRRTIEKN